LAFKVELDASNDLMSSMERGASIGFVSVFYSPVAACGFVVSVELELPWGFVLSV
jgi:hypothetical protein